MRVMMVSKPVCPPWTDSSKNLAKDIACWAQKTEFVLLGRSDFRPDWPRIAWSSIYPASGKYSPGLAQNGRVLLRLLLPPDGISAFHYFFAPNPRTSRMARLVSGLRRVPTVHSICSLPASFESLRSWMFADRVVALSQYSASRLREAGVSGVTCIPPGIDPDRLKPPAENALARRLGVEGHPTVLYAGDYESPSGYDVLLAAIPEVLSALPEARFVFACRLKTPLAQTHEATARATAATGGFAGNVSFLNEVDDMSSLLGLATVSALPAANLHRKMDLPLVLLESMALQRPVVVSDVEPMREILAGGGGFAVPLGDARTLARRLLEVLKSPSLAAELGAQARAAVLERWHIAEVARRYEALYDELLRSDRP